MHGFQGMEDWKKIDLFSYLYNARVHGSECTVCLDVNIYQFVLNGVKKSGSKQEYKDAIGLVCFCQLANIEVEPSIAVYEKLNYEDDIDRLVGITSDLELFNKINNVSDDQLIRYSFGEIEHISLTNKHGINHDRIRKKLTQHNRLLGWDSLYLIVLFIAFTSQDLKKTQSEKLRCVVEWMIADFRFSLFGIVYAAVFFSKNPLKRMMKFKRSDEPSKKKKALHNMTWDFYAMDKFLKGWVRGREGGRYIYATGDKALKHLLRTSMAIQAMDTLEPLRDYIDDSDFDYIEKAIKTSTEAPDRAYNSKFWGQEYRQKLIDELSKRLGVECA